MKYFNTAGPIKADIHYFLSPLERINKEELLALIGQQKYFVLHAPRQTGKTSCLLALMHELNQGSAYRALYINVEAGQAMRENVREAMRGILNQISSLAEFYLKDSFPREHMEQILTKAGTSEPLFEMLQQWSYADPRPIVLMIDEIDALIGDTLLSVLRQLRTGYTHRPEGFPQSVILCGVRDVRDYRIHSSTTKEIITGGSAFNIKAESLRLGNFSPDEIRRLYLQHTEETGQVFDEAIFPLVWELTGGQPWLVNALAYEVCFRPGAGKDRSQPITVELITEAKEQLILRRDTHLDQLVDKLTEPRVRRVIEPILSGEAESETIPPDDLQYVRDLGLITQTKPPEIANRIYQEVIPRELTWVTQEYLVQETAWYVAPDGRLDMPKLLTAFQQFFRENSEIWLERFDYKEAGPQLLLQAFLQRIINGGGELRREYGLGRKRTDLLILWTYPGGVQRVVLELKIARSDPKTLLAGALAQTADYADKCGAQEAHLIIFDRRKRRKWTDKIYHRPRKFQGQTITVWGM